MSNRINNQNIKYPNTFSVSRGQTLLATPQKSVSQSIKLILSTSKGELFGDPDFGCDLKKLTYGYQGTSLEDSIRSEIVTALNTYEPRIFIKSENITISYKDKTVVVNLKYSLRYTDYQEDFQYIISDQED